MTELFERGLRSSFVRADLPLAPDRLREVLFALPVTGAPVAAPRARRVGPSWLQMAAVLALLAVIGGALAFGVLNRPDQGGPGPTPSPSPSISPKPSGSGQQTRSLPAPAGLLSGYVLGGLSYERSVGPADQPLSHDATITQTDLGPLEYARDIVLAAACLGPGELNVTVRYTTLPSVVDPFVGLVAPCDGDVAAISYTGLPGDQVEIEVISVSVSAGASWRFAIGEIPDPVAPATFAPIAGTAGWWRLWDVQMDAVDPRTGMGVGIRVADAVTRLALWIECSGADSVELALVHDQASPADDYGASVACVPGQPQRNEVAVSAGDIINVTVTSEDAIPVHMYVEADAMPVSEWGAPPDLTADLAQSAFMASSGTYVALGQLGAPRQALVPVAGVGPVNRPGGEFAALPEMSPGRTLLGLYSVVSGERLMSLAEHEAGTFIATTWVDAVHEQVLYAVGTRSGLTLFRVGLDGTNQQLLATIPVAATSSLATLALDGSTFVADACAATGCQRTLIDMATLEVRQANFVLDGEVCAAAGTSDGVVVLRIADACDATGPQQILVTDLDGSELLRVPDPGFVTLVQTGTGPALLTGDPFGSGFSVVDIDDGSSTQLEVDASTLIPVQGVQLPPDWILLAPFQGIGDFPVHPSLLLGNPPLLVNVVTGDVIEMVNLPH